jgi:hypothetical protein
MRNVSDKICRENQNISYVQQLFSKNRAVYGIMCKNIADRERLQTIQQHGVCAFHAE